MRTRIIAEAGINHNGDLDTALEMVRVAKECGADTVKFQHIDPLHFKPGMVWQGYNMRELFKCVRFSMDQWRQIMMRCEQENIGFLCTPQTVGDFEELLELGIKEVKISSDNLGNGELLKRVSEARIPAIMSIGMASESEIEEACKKVVSDLVLMVCTSEYPCAPEGANMSRFSWTPYGNSLYVADSVGFSDHIIGNTAAIMAVALGATVIEKHFTLDHSMEGPDHAWSVQPYELKSYVAAIREAELMLGTGEFKPTEKELETKKLLGV